VRHRPSVVVRLVAAIAGLCMIALAAIPTIGLASLFTLSQQAGSSPVPTVSSSPDPGASAKPTPSATPPTSLVASPDATPTDSGSPPASPEPSPGDGTASPTPAAVVQLRVDLGGQDVFVSQATVTWCASAAIQNVVNVVGRNPDTSRAFQASIEQSAARYTTRADSRNGGWGPRGMADALTTLTQTRYVLKIAATRDEAVKMAVTAIAVTRRPAVLLAWRGAHAWVVSGYRVTADPLSGEAFRVSAIRVLDPWYPRTSNIWGKSKAPGSWHDAPDLERNYLPWRRPEAKYPGRDGNFLLIIPVAGAG
jgi:hypothetical protein